MTEHSPYQRKIIGRYYDRREEIMLARLGEIVSELFLAESDAKLEQLWKRAHKAMNSLGITPSIAEHIFSKRDPEVLARNLSGWLKAGGVPRNANDAGRERGSNRQ